MEKNDEINELWEGFLSGEKSLSDLELYELRKFIPDTVLRR